MVQIREAAWPHCAVVQSLRKQNWPDFPFTDLEEQILWYIKDGPGMMRTFTEIVRHFIPYKSKVTILKHLKLMREGNVIERVETLAGPYHMFYCPKLPGTGVASVCSPRRRAENDALRDSASH
jgi:hypothetical protein